MHLKKVEVLHAGCNNNVFKIFIIRMSSQNFYSDLKRKIVLAEMAGYSDGSFCIKNGAGSGLVMLGTYIIDSSEKIPYPDGFYFSPDKKLYYKNLERNICIVKNAKIKAGVSAVSIDIKDTISFLKTAQDLGADYLSYCAHSVMKMFLEKDTSSALCLKKNHEKLKRVLHDLKDNLELPLIIKLGIFDNEYVMDAIKIINDCGFNLFHINFERTKNDSPGLELLGKVKNERIFIIAGGGIKNTGDVLRVLDKGADAVSIATAAIKYPDLIKSIKNELENKKPERQQ